MKKIACIIPARLKSSRFPQKILKNLAGKPLLQWVWEAATGINCFGSVLFAIDSQETATLIESFGGKYLMTSEACRSGTDRLIEVMQSGAVEADVWVNWQADEPFVTAQMVERLLSSCDDGADMWTLKKPVTDKAFITCPNVVKVVCDAADYALYFSRHPIPFYREQPPTNQTYYKHIGLYAYTTEALQKISCMEPSNLEVAEKLEQLRFLQHQIKIKVHEIAPGESGDLIGIDTPQDLEQAEELIRSRGF